MIALRAGTGMQQPDMPLIQVFTHSTTYHLPLLKKNPMAKYLSMSVCVSNFETGHI
jgi:hypothetical protein